MTKQEEMREGIKEIHNRPLVMAKFFEKPKCKPWDLVKGRRLRCCHGLGEHTRWCFDGVTTIIVPKLHEISMKDLI
ncbi:hypothetical protein LCGC14_2239280 [marine sediment metagenome]|uniref:Uncharacterized protein n=1 Tax=marine sediment metagenome TaxID=412755 RepID=A0A0F9FIG9_9ZZZZ